MTKSKFLMIIIWMALATGCGGSSNNDEQIVNQWDHNNTNWDNAKWE